MGQRGDTIVEVLFAVTVFSLIAVGGLALMNQGTAMTQRSLEIGLVRDQMDAQSDALRYMQNAYESSLGQDGAAAITAWNEVTTKHAVSKAQNYTDISDGKICQLPSTSYAVPGSDGRPFAIDITKLDGTNGSPVLTLAADSATKTVTYSKVRYYEDDDYKIPLNPAQAEGIWIQPVYSPGVGSKIGYYDFHISACWLTPGQSAPVTLGTIVRLYEPKA